MSAGSAAELFAKAAAPRAPRFAEWVDSLPKADRDAFYSFAGNGEITHAAFLRIARELGASVGKESVTTWRRKHGFGG